MNGGAREPHRGQSEVSPAVDHKLNFAPQYLSVFTDCRAMASSRRMALRGGGHVFHTVVNDFYRTPALVGQQYSVGRNDRGIFFFAAKSSSGLHLYDTNFFSGQAEQGHQGFVDIVRTLQRSPDRNSLLWIETGDHSIVLDIELLLCARVVFGFDDMV